MAELADAIVPCRKARRSTIVAQISLPKGATPFSSSRCVIEYITRTNALSNESVSGGCSSAVERRCEKPEVTGSNPVLSFCCTHLLLDPLWFTSVRFRLGYCGIPSSSGRTTRSHGPVTQLLETRFWRGVVGANPAWNVIPLPRLPMRSRSAWVVTPVLRPCLGTFLPLDVARRRPSAREAFVGRS
jgi:hypothetical protein